MSTQQLIEILLTAIVSFLIGSIPTAYLAVKRAGLGDLRRLGSGNIGARNAYEISGSKRIGAVVLVIDFLKGFIPAGLAHFLFQSDYLVCGAAIIGAVAGHNFTPWLRFKGGRGLATAAGGAVLFNPVIAFAWLVFWAAAYWKTHSTPFANISATVLAPLLLLAIPGIIRFMSVVDYSEHEQLLPVIIVLSVVILMRHGDMLKELFTKGITPD